MGLSEPVVAVAASVRGGAASEVNCGPVVAGYPGGGRRAWVKVDKGRVTSLTSPLPVGP